REQCCVPDSPLNEPGDDGAHVLRTSAMAISTRAAALGRPASVAVHDDGDVPGHDCPIVGGRR
ncbi:MAG: hypothetical protein QGI75_09335, partial [Phycisphaerales bacterium]|nr:hypothetical protein [Phycisphaerales bacterium]